MNYADTPPSVAAVSLERSGEEGTPGFRDRLKTLGKALEKEYPSIQCIGCKKTFKEPLWRCSPCLLKKEKVVSPSHSPAEPGHEHSHSRL